MLRAGANVRNVQDVLGHRSAARLEPYLELTVTELEDAHARYHPRARPGSRSRDRDSALQDVVLPQLPVLPVDLAVASRYGAIRSDLARVGRTVADLDLLIAATALTHGRAVVTRNVRHFGRIPKIELADWFGSTG